MHFYKISKQNAFFTSCHQRSFHCGNCEAKKYISNSSESSKLFDSISKRIKSSNMAC